ncbi:MULTISPECIES: dihydrodipicolinate synthase family protein [Proteus]|uniref:dihydrodipicolinate synthase family protein n=1 Tax=Proteus TaxID=583 RepID=UPI001377B5A0|nr:MULTISPECIES: dihydrodipicolinate synthase family protein [Proteus]MCO8050637.1 dihydrodipicolinate synthase family protein [Proteus penneri]MCX2587140.1 dihydrodipicolinate synthase family protein [Proteus penneri]NBL76085.1 dihydrodipicolinate synthase family protein [Proteus sp. G2672]NBM58009.1 dihydrodipicolinate synthase family protein [Proteus sp. G2667]NBM89408.1 dihydrodipicolinate synthase family protein [Proteus sp. G2658]
MKKLFGVTVAMVTPFDSNDQVDIKALSALTDMLVTKGVDCLYPCGTTGEMLRLSALERKNVAKTVVETVNKRLPVFIHVGAMTLIETIELAKHAVEIGADGIGVVTPQFFGATDRELENYFVTVANSVPDDFPVYLYNIPQCAANNIKPELAAKVQQQCKNVIGIKYSFADNNTTLSYLAIADGFSVLHGYDKLFLGLLDAGCDGTVSGCACVFPEPFVNMYKAYIAGDHQEAKHWQQFCVKFSDALKSGANMAIFKSALTMRGLDGGHMRLPQLDLLPEENQKLKENLTQLCKNAGITFSLN